MDRHLLFRIEREQYALPLYAVREVVVPAALSRVPRSPDAVLGIMNLRGRIVTVVDARVLFALGAPAAAEPAPQGKLVILDRGRRDLGLLVGEVEGIVLVGEIAPVAGGGSAVRGVATFAVNGGTRLATVLDADALDAQVASLFGEGAERPPT